MNAKQLKIIVHILVWLLLLAMPYISTDQIFESIDSTSGLNYPFLSLGLNFLLLGTFYFNYFVLIPKYLFAERRWRYWEYLGLLIITVCAMMWGVLLITGFTPKVLNNSNPVIEKVMPVIIVNAMALWLLAIMMSIIWTYYKRIKRIENEKLTAQIASLRFQINPHFLFNTLNNIYGTVIDTSPMAADMIDKLSEMMRYAINDTQHDFVQLEDEIAYIKNYVELQRLRIDKSVTVEYVEPSEIPADLHIAPMLLIPFVENAFKYGVNSEQRSHIRIEITVQDSELHLSVINNKVKTQQRIAESHGLGVKNAQSRLELLYPSKHLLVINDTPKQHIVSLHVNLQ